MGDNFKKVQTGDKLRIPAAAYNAFIDSAHDFQDRQRNQGRTPQAAYRTSGIVLVKNASGADQDRFAVLGVDAPIYTPEDNLDSFKNKVALVGVVPTVQDHYGRFVVLLEPLKAGAIGMAYGAGVCPVKITIPDDEQTYQFADVNDGSTGTLLAAPLGAAFILWKEDDEATGEMWAVVRIGLPPIRPFALDPCDSEDGDTRYVTNDLSKKLDKVLLVDDICYTVRVPGADEIKCIEPVCIEIQEEYDDCERCKGCWLLTPCIEGEAEIKTNTDLASYEGGVVKLDDGKCYVVSLAQNCLDAVPVTVEESFDDCTRCGYCYHLENCFDEYDTRVIDNDLESLFEQTPEEIVADGRVVEIGGQCYTVVAYDTTCPDVETVTIDRIFASCGECGCFQLTSCEGDPPTIIYTRRAYGPGGGLIALRDYVGQILRLADGYCYSVEESEECETLTDINVQEAYDDCESCTCWLLTDCEDEYNTLLTFSDLSAHGVGAIVRQAGTDPIKCWTITETAPWSGSAVAFEVDDEFPDCDTCLKKQKYLLTQDCNLEDCEGSGGGGGDEIITTEDLYAAVGMWVKVGGKCYSVATTDTGDVTDETLSYQGPFASCDACLESPVDTKKRFITDLALDGTNLVAKTEEMVIKGGKIVGFCESDDFTIEGTECPEEGGA
jgi:hypothetical protein